MGELRAKGDIYYNEGEEDHQVVLQPDVTSESRSLPFNYSGEEVVGDILQESREADGSSKLVADDEEPVQASSGQGLDSPPASEENQERTSLLSVLKDQVVDDATLDVPSSFLRANRVFKINRKQVVIERHSNKEGNDDFLAKEINTGSAGLLLLRGIYTAVAFLMSGFMFNFCVQVFLYLFLGLVTELGGVGREVDDAFTFFPFMGILLSIPVFLIAFANMMTLAMVFVQNTWNGHHFTKTALKWKSVIVDWVALLVFVVVPIMVGTISLYANVDDWWNNTLLAWMICVFSYFLAFSIFAIYHEVNGCYQLIEGKMIEKHIERATASVQEKWNSKNEVWKKGFHKSWKKNHGSFWKICCKAILIKMHYSLDIVQKVKHLSSKYDENEITYDKAIKQQKEQERRCRCCFSPSKALSTIFSKCFYDLVKDPVNTEKYYSIENVQHQTPFVTRNTWSLEELFCRDRNKRHIAVIKDGEGERKYSLTEAQKRSSLACYILGAVFAILLCVGLMVWFGLFDALSSSKSMKKNKVVAGFVAAFLLLVILYSVFLVIDDPVRKFRYLEKQKESEILYEIVDHYKIAKAKNWVCWVCFFFQILVFFVLPVGAIFHNKNYPLGAFFTCVSLVTGMRWYINSTNCIQKYGTYKSMEWDNKYKGDDSEDAKDEKWREEHRLGLINREISSGSKNFFWQCVFLFFTFAFCGICVFAINTGEGQGAEAKTQGKKDSYRFIKSWEYRDSGTMEYPSCSIGENFQPPSNAETSLVDFAFLSKMAYRSDDSAKSDMNEWFGNDTEIEFFTNNHTVIEEFEYKRPSNVVYKLFGFPNEEEPQKSVAILSIKGTDNGWDILADAQLWAGAAISQFVRSLMPLGSLFTPLLEDLIWFVSLIESNNLRKQSFYQKITALVHHLDSNTTFVDNDTIFKKKYPHLILTGHSLGGGLAMISGAQTRKPVIALSGPNALLSRRTFEPVILPEDLKKYTFNIVPDRDPVPRIDDLSKNFQRIQCRTSANNFIGCHFGDQSICELLLSCGSEGRPIPCKCIGEGMDDIFSKNLKPVEGTNEDKESLCK